jgi:soluble lytic murein transglycosylase
MLKPDNTRVVIGLGSNVGDRAAHLRVAITQFMDGYAGSFVADRLRNDWLYVLARRGDWAQFDMQLPQFVLADDPQIDCLAIASKAAQSIGNSADLRQQARNALLRNTAHASGSGCSLLLTIMVNSNRFSEADAADAAHVKHELRRNASTANVTGHTAAHRAVHSAALCAQKLGNDCTDYFRAQNKPIALPANLQGTGSDNALEWAVRGALRVQDWGLVTALIQRFPPHLQDDPAWVYWLARAYTLTQQPEAAKPLYEKIASGWGFYHLLAKEALGQTITLPAAITPDEAAVKQALQRAEVERMQTFYRLGLRWEGNREWNWMLRGQSDAQLSALAEAGRRLGHYDRMVNTAERTKVQLDFSQRFPMPFFKQAQPAAAQLKLDTNWVYGLIRQESRFIVEVRSHVGAQGLMQVMPKTAAWVAKKINLPNYDPDRVQEPEINLIIGQAYLAMVLADLDNLPILATAAYNAGPGRPKAWRASLAAPVEGAIFAETIPFNETRGYVKNVLANAALYGATTGNQPKSLNAWLGKVAPKAAVSSDLP